MPRPISAARLANSERFWRCDDCGDDDDDGPFVDMSPLAAAFSVWVRRDCRWAERALDFAEPVEERACLRCAWARIERNSVVRS